jgi:hypothetical protein
MKAEVNTLVEGTRGMNTAKHLEKFAPWSATGMIGGLGGGHALSTWLGPNLGHALGAGLPWAVGVGAKAAYPYLTKQQAAKVIEMIKKGKPVPGAPTYMPAPPSALSYPGLLPPLTMDYFLNQSRDEQAP